MIMNVVALYVVVVAVVTRTIEGQATTTTTITTTTAAAAAAAASIVATRTIGDPVSSTVDLSISTSLTDTTLQPSPVPTGTATRNDSQCRKFNSTTDPCGVNGRNIFFPNNDTLVTDRDVFFQSLSIFKLVTSVASNSICTTRLLQLLCASVYPVCDDTSQPRAPCPEYCSCVLTSECRAVWNDLTARIGPQLENSTNPEFTELLTLTKIMSAQQNCSNNRTILFYQNTMYSSNCVDPDSTQCDESDDTTIPPTTILTTTVIAGIAAGGGAAVLLIIFACLVCCCCCCGCCCRKRKHPLLGFGEQPLFPESGTNTILRLAQRGRYKSKFRSPRELLKNVPEVYRSEIEPYADFLIQESRIQTTSFLAEGNHSEVYQGSIVDLQPYETSVYRTVAVKTFREHVAIDEVKQYLKACLTISTVSHPNVLKIIGVSFNSFAGANIVCPYMEEHDLVTYLKKLRSSVLSPTPAQDFTVRRLADIVSQVCHGMRALSRKKIVYKMLSAHTCMVDQQQRVTVGDVSLDKLNYFCQQEQSAGREYNYHHQKWLAPESIEGGEFSEKSDVWSFGVTLWEILSFGNPPFNDVSDDNFLDYIKSGQSASQPPLCPDSLFNILQDCWKIDPKERPTFLILDQSISALISQPRFANEIAIIDKKLLKGDLTSAVSLPRSANSTSRLERQNVPRPSVSSMAAAPIQEEPSKTDDGYLKVLGSATKSDSVQEARYVTIKKAQDSGDIDEAYDYINPVHAAAKEGSPIVSTTLHIGNWGDPDDEDGYVDVTPKGSPNVQKSDRHSLTDLTGIKHSFSQSSVSTKDRSESEYYNLPNVVPKSERHLSLPKTTKPLPLPKPSTLRPASTSSANGTTRKPSE